MPITDSLKNLLKETATQLRGVSIRRFQAQTVLEFGYGGQLLAEKELGWVDRQSAKKLGSKKVVLIVGITIAPEGERK